MVTELNNSIYLVFLNAFIRISKSGSREEGGSGLGLAIVKHIIEAHNEKIFVQSTPQKGSEFSFTLKTSK